MNKKLTIIEKLRLAFSEEEQVVEVEFAEFKTADGMTLKVSEIKEGEIVSVVSGEGDEMTEEVAGEGSYTLEDGREISLDAEGKITEIKEAEAEAEAEAEPLEMSAIIEAVKESNKEDNEVLMSALNDIAKTLLEQEERIENFAKAPAKAPKKVGKKQDKKQKELSPLEQLAEFRAAQK